MDSKYCIAMFAAALVSAATLFAREVGNTTDNAVEADRDGAANCFVITSAGEYTFSPRKADGTNLKESVRGVEVLWALGAGTCQNGIVSDVRFDGEYVRFRTAESLAGGNVLIAATGESGEVLWSWHLWLLPGGFSECAYGDEVMMDRNLGALCTTGRQDEATALYWQWGRKDPFPRSPLHVLASDPECGTEAYATAHPTTFLTGNDKNHGWLYTSDGSADASRWGADKTVNDPCPAGWRIPDGGLKGVLSAGEGMRIYDSSETGLGAFAGDGQQSWLPACGYLSWDDGRVHNVKAYGFYWTLGTAGHFGRHMMFFRNGYQTLEHATYMSYGQSVRCQKVKE